MLNQSVAAKEIRKIARNNGLTFKRIPGATLNGAALYRFVRRDNGSVVLDNCQFWTAYENCMSGYIDKLGGLGQGKKEVVYQCSEYSVAGDRCWIVKINGKNQGGYLSAEELSGVLGEARAQRIIEKEAADYLWSDWV